MNTLISTPRLSLRNIVPSDLGALVAMNEDEEVMKYFPSILSQEQTIQFMDRIFTQYKENGFGLYAVTLISSDALIGLAGFMMPSFESFFTPCVEIGWRFKKEFWGQGYASEASTACLKYAKTLLGLKEILSFTSIQNKKSEAVMKNIGMKKQGHFVHPKLDKDHWLSEHVLYSIQL